jgi:hypothetical protein
LKQLLFLFTVKVCVHQNSDFRVAQSCSKLEAILSVCVACRCASLDIARHKATKKLSRSAFLTKKHTIPQAISSFIIKMVAIDHLHKLLVLNLCSYVHRVLWGLKVQRISSVCKVAWKSLVLLMILQRYEKPVCKFLKKSHEKSVLRIQKHFSTIFLLENVHILALFQFNVEIKWICSGCFFWLHH